MDLFPAEIIFNLSKYFNLPYLAQMREINRRFNILFSHLLNQRQNLIPWSITVDYARDSNHHIHLHKSWIKIGWFNPKLFIDGIQSSPLKIFQSREETDRKLVKKRQIVDLFEVCPLCYDFPLTKRFTVVKSGIGGPMIFHILKCNEKGYVTLSKGYYPLIIDLLHTRFPHGQTDVLVIDGTFLTGDEFMTSSQTKTEHAHNIIYKYGEQSIYRNKPKKWKDIYDAILSSPI